MTVAAIFDCDGVLIDSANVWRDAEAELCRRAGCSLTQEEERAIVTLTVAEVGEFLHERIGLGSDGDHVVRMIDDLMLDYYANRAQPIEGADDLVEGLNERGVALSVVSSSPKEYLVAGLERIGIASLFKEIISASDLGVSKREPLAFQHAMNVMGSVSQDTWGFDDSHYAVTAMRNIDICTVGVYDADDPYEFDSLREAAHIVTCDYSQLDLKLFADGPRALLKDLR